MIVGMTGSGKTTLAKALLAVRDYVVVLDMKGLISWGGYKRVTTLAEAMNERDARKIVYAPNHIELQSPATIDKFFRWIFERRNTTLYVDEVYAVCHKGQIPFHYNAVLTRGRERNISTISSVQRPKQIPQTILSESEYHYIFKLLMPQDRQRMNDVIGVSAEEIERLEKYQFLFATAAGDKMGPLKLAV